MIHSVVTAYSTPNRRYTASIPGSTPFYLCRMVQGSYYQLNLRIFVSNCERQTRFEQNYIAHSAIPLVDLLN